MPSSTSLRRRAILAAGAALSALSLAAPAAAQPSREIEELVVTARKVEENLKDVPVSVTALSSATMEGRLIQDLRDVAQFTPGFQLNQAFGRSGDRPVIRGASNILTGEGKVGIFVGGIPFFGNFSALDLENAARVEVIRGPQSAVFGRGTLSGAINITPRRPTDGFTMRIKATAGSYDRKELGAYAGGPLFGGLSADVSFKVYELGNVFDNTVRSATDLGGESSEQITAGLYYDPTPDISISARYMMTKDDDEHNAIWLQPSTFNNCYLTTRPYYCGVVRTPGPFAINTDRLQAPGLRRDGDRGFFDAQWNIMGSGYTLSYQAGVTEVTTVSGIDQSYDARDFFVLGASCPFVPIANQNCARAAFNTTDANQRNAVTHELRLSSPADQPIRWRAGLYQGLDRSKPLARYLEATETGLDPLGDATRIKNFAVFGAVDWDMTDTLTFGVELRRQTDKVRATTLAYTARQYFDPSQLALLRGPNPNQVVGAAAVREATFKKTLPRVTVTWKATPQDTIFAQYSVGNSPGGFNPLDAPQTTFAEEELKNWEVGAKSTRFGFDYVGVSVFFQKYSGQVLTNTYQTPTFLGSYRANIGETEIKGLELEGSHGLGLPGLKAQFTYTYIDAEIVKGVEPEQAILLLGTACKQGTTATTNLNLPGCLAAASIVGKRPPIVSKHAASFGVRYDGDPMVKGFAPFAGVDVTYRSSFFDQVMNLAETGSATKVNFQLGVHDDNGLRIFLWGKNLFDNDTPEGILRYVDLAIGVPRAPSRDSARAFAITPARPVEYGVTVSKSW